MYNNNALLALSILLSATRRGCIFSLVSSMQFEDVIAFFCNFVFFLYITTLHSFVSVYGTCMLECAQIKLSSDLGKNKV